MEDTEYNRGKLITKLYKNETRSLLNEFHSKETAGQDQYSGVESRQEPKWAPDLGKSYKLLKP